jgi:hypothetical protein
MSFFTLKLIKQYEDPNKAVEKIHEILKSGSIPEQQLTRTEIEKLSRGSISGLFFYPEKEVEKPFDERTKISLNFTKNRSQKDRKYKYGMKLGEYLIKLAVKDAEVTSKGTFLEGLHEKSGTEENMLQIPLEVIQKLKPELIQKDDGRTYALIKISNSNFEKLSPYFKIGLFLKKFRVLLEYHNGEKTQENLYRMQTFFATKSEYEKFIREHANTMLKVIEEKNKPVEEKLAEVIKDKYGVSIPIMRLKRFSNLMRTMPEQNMNEMKDEIISVAEHRGE